MTPWFGDRFRQFPLWPALISVLAHALLLVIVPPPFLPKSPPAEAPATNVVRLQIHLDPRPVPEMPPAPSTSQEPLAAESGIIRNESEIVSTDAPEIPMTQQTVPIDDSPAPRLLAPVTTDLREVIRSRDANMLQRRSWQLDCDERQRRHTMIDCGEPDNAVYDFAAADINPVVDYFTTPADNNAASDVLTDLTSQQSRAQAARQNAVGHLAGEQLRNSVMNVQ